MYISHMIEIINFQGELTDVLDKFYSHVGKLLKRCNAIPGVAITSLCQYTNLEQFN